MISKAAALYVQNFDDPVTLDAVNDVEQLTSSLSQKLWLNDETSWSAWRRGLSRIRAR